MPPKAKKAPRCAFIEGSRRCHRSGAGNPPLCEPHRLVLEEEANRPQRAGERFANLLGRVFRGQKISDEHIFGGIEDFVSMFPGATETVREQARRFDPRAEPRRTPPPRPPPRRPAGPDPRLVLGFAIGQRVTEAEVKARHRELARKHHPDRGGSVGKMQEINAAVDQLLSTM